MAQTKRKRRSKHRGTPAGTVEARGRTSRPPSTQEKKKQARAQAREKRLNQRPTWKTSFTRAGFAAGLLFLFLVLTGPKKDRVGLESLSQREFEMLRLLGSGMSLKECTQHLNISTSSASTYRTRIMEKLNLRTTAELIRYALEQGLVG